MVAASALSAAETYAVPRPMRNVVVVGISGAHDAIDVLDAAARLADAFGAVLEAVHVETPGTVNGDAAIAVADVLSKAQGLGASVSRVPAATVADGLIEHVRSAGASHLVLGHRHKPGLFRKRNASLLDRVLEREHSLELLLVPRDRTIKRPRVGTGNWRGSPADFAIAVGAIAVTFAVAALLRLTTDVVSTSILFLFPVIAVAARSGLGPTLFSVVMAVIGHNILLLPPPLRLDAFAIQSWMMAAVLLVGGTYTSIITSSLRGRARLSDRSARESTRLAAYANRLTRLSDWESTGAAICQEISQLLEIQTVMFREIDGKLTRVAEHPEGVMLEPIDEITLRWVWESGTDRADGRTAVQPGEWQFHPLITSLGVLAVIGLARPNGGPPIPADRSVLISTLFAQTSLALERLRLEDQMRLDPPEAG